MTSLPLTESRPLPADWRDLFALTKPRVMRLVVFTALCGLLASRAPIHPIIGFAAILCIALAAGAAGALNQWYEADIDAQMKRTAARPLPGGRMSRQTALHFGVGLSVGSVVLMDLATNHVAAIWLAVSILFYVFIYTAWLKPRTAQNIVIGGAAGAFPPLIGWAAATGDTPMLAWLMFGIIFLWTPPHFWALSLWVRTDYEKAGIPMLPVVSGTRVTRNQILLYTFPMVAVALAPWALGLTGWIFGTTSAICNAIFLVLAVRVWRNQAEEPAGMKPEKQLFAFSILYLFILFGALVADRMLLP